MKRNARTKKIICLGVDGLDPRLTRKYVDEGKMPNVKKYIERGSCREDLVLLGGHPTVTPPMWTTLATGCYANVHGITGFFRKPDIDAGEAPSLSYQCYNLNSMNCKAEQIWNCFAEAGWKTLVWHWPGSSWPPSSDSENLLVVDGTVPGSVNVGASVEKEFLVIANKKVKAPTFKLNAANNMNAACVIDNLEAVDRDVAVAVYGKGMGSMATTPPRQNIVVDCMNQGQMASHKNGIDVAYSSLKEAEGWAFEVPDNALEFTILFSGGLLPRPCLLTKSADDEYDTVTIYAKKSDPTPLTTAKKGEFVRDFMDIVKNDDGSTTNVNRNYCVIDIDPNGDRVRMWISSAMDYSNDTFWSPKSLFYTIRDNVGCPPPTTMVGTQEKELILDVTLRAWEHIADWQAAGISNMLDHEDVDVVFSHYHAVDLVEHRFIRYMYDKGQNLVPEHQIEVFMEELYKQTDRYLGKFLHYLDEGATVLIFSDHAQVCSHYNPDALMGCNSQKSVPLVYIPAALSISISFSASPNAIVSF